MSSVLIGKPFAGCLWVMSYFFPPLQQRPLHTALILAQCWNFSEKEMFILKTKTRKAFNLRLRNEGWIVATGGQFLSKMAKKLKLTIVVQVVTNV